MRRWLLEAATDDPKTIIHNHGMWQWNSVYPGQVARRTGATLICSPRGTFSKWAMGQGSRAKRLFWPTFQRPACEASRCFHATSPAEADDIRALGFRQPITVIPNGIDVPPENKLTFERERMILFLGRVHPVKGIDFLLRAWSLLQDRHMDWSLCIAGSDEGYYGTNGYLRELQELTQRLGLSRVRFVGDVRGEAKEALLSSAALFVLPTHSENFGVAVAEALAWSVPCIVTKGAPWGGLHRERAGWWIDRDIDAISSALDEAMATDEQARWEMGARGRKWVSEEFSWPSIGLRMAQTYAWLQGDGPRPDSVV